VYNEKENILYYNVISFYKKYIIQSGSSVWLRGTSTT